MAFEFQNAKAAARREALGTTGVLSSTNFIDPLAGDKVFSVEATVTLAQLNAGHTLVSAVEGRTLKPISVLMVYNGTFTTSTDIRISDTAGTPVEIVTVAIANATNGTRHGDLAATGVTFGAGYGVNLTADKGIQIRKTGSTAAGGTDIFCRILYKIS